jgi:hypothetical protein
VCVCVCVAIVTVRQYTIIIAIGALPLLANRHFVNRCHDARRVPCSFYPLHISAVGILSLFLAPLRCLLRVDVHITHHPFEPAAVRAGVRGRSLMAVGGLRPGTVPLTVLINSDL